MSSIEVEHLRRVAGTEARRLRGSRRKGGEVTTAVVAGVMVGRIVPVYLDGDTTVPVPARFAGGPHPQTGDLVAIWREGRKLRILGVPAEGVDYGRVTVPVVAGVGSASLTFEPGLFVASPVLVLTPEGGTGQTWKSPQVTVISNDGATVALTQDGGTSYTGSRNVGWVAMGR